MRVVITLACTECKQKNYSTTKNIKKDKNGKEPGPMEVAKFCRYCKKKSLEAVLKILLGFKVEAGPSVQPL